MAELVDALDLGSSSKEWEFDSSCPHQAKKEKSFRLFFFYNKIRFLTGVFIISKSN